MLSRKTIQLLKLYHRLGRWLFLLPYVGRKRKGVSVFRKDGFLNGCIFWHIILEFLIRVALVLLCVSLLYFGEGLKFQEQVLVVGFLVLNVVMMAVFITLILYHEDMALNVNSMLFFNKRMGKLLIQNQNIKKKLITPCMILINSSPKIWKEKNAHPKGWIGKIVKIHDWDSNLGNYDRITYPYSLYFGNGSQIFRLHYGLGIFLSSSNWIYLSVRGRNLQCNFKRLYHHFRALPSHLVIFFELLDSGTH